MYKDKDKQRQAVKEAVRRYRANHKGITGVDGNAHDVIPCNASSVIPKAEPEPQSHNSMMVGYVPKPILK